jgi:hypothetical protein
MRSSRAIAALMLHALTKSCFLRAILLMRLCIFAKVEFLTAITAFELFSSFFHDDHLP